MILSSRGPQRLHGNSHSLGKNYGTYQEPQGPARDQMSTLHGGTDVLGGGTNEAWGAVITVPQEATLFWSTRWGRI
jgi:hypothetical protein